MTPSIDTRLKFIFVLEFSVFLNSVTKNKSGVNPVEGVTRGGKKTAKKVITKRSSVFRKKNRVTPSVAAPGDIKPSDATGYFRYTSIHLLFHLRMQVFN